MTPNDEVEDLSIYGVHITKDGKRIDPKDYYTPSLLPCPFCGSAAEIRTYQAGEWDKPKDVFHVLCSNPKCTVRPGTIHNVTRDYVINQWNKRHEIDEDNRCPTCLKGYHRVDIRKLRKAEK